MRGPPIHRGTCSAPDGKGLFAGRLANAGRVASAGGTQGRPTRDPFCDGEFLQLVAHLSKLLAQLCPHFKFGSAGRDQLMKARLCISCELTLPLRITSSTLAKARYRMTARRMSLGIGHRCLNVTRSPGLLGWLQTSRNGSCDETVPHNVHRADDAAARADMNGTLLKAQMTDHDAREMLRQ